MKDREAILRARTRNKPLAGDVDLAIHRPWHAHRESYLELVRRLEEKETLLADEIRACLVPEAGQGKIR